MVQFDSGGHEDLRAYIQNNWDYLELKDDTGSTVTRISISSDGRTSWSSGSASNPLTISGTFTGGDSDITTPVTLASGELYKGSGTMTSMASDSITNATLEASADTVDITIDVEMPNL